MLLAAAVIGFALSAFEPAPPQADSLPLRHAVRAGLVEIGWPDLAQIAIADGFRYVGGQRFVLRGVADAEQHAFVIADANGLVLRLLWIQIEHYLPSAAGAYDYSADSPVTVAGHALHFGMRRYTSPPDPTSDRGALYGFLRQAGYEPPAMAERMRWVNVAADRRSEVMIIHAERDSAASSRTTEPTSARVSRAQAAFDLLPRGPR